MSVLIPWNSNFQQYIYTNRFYPHQPGILKKTGAIQLMNWIKQIDQINRQFFYFINKNKCIQDVQYDIKATIFIINYYY